MRLLFRYGLLVLCLGEIGCADSPSATNGNVEAEEFTFQSESDGITLAGTLIRPEGDGPFPAVVLLSGMRQNRNAQMTRDHKPFRVLARHLSRHGLVVLRYDKRGVGASEG